MPPASAGYCRGQYPPHTGWVFVQMGGTVVERMLASGEELHVDTGCLAAYTPSVDFDLVAVGGIRTMFGGGEGAFFARLRGPGKVWIQSLPFSRLAGRMLAAAGGRGGNRGEGGVLGGLGDFIGGMIESKYVSAILGHCSTIGAAIGFRELFHFRK